MDGSIGARRARVRWLASLGCLLSVTPALAGTSDEELLSLSLDELVTIVVSVPAGAPAPGTSQARLPGCRKVLAPPEDPCSTGA